MKKTRNFFSKYFFFLFRDHFFDRSSSMKQKVTFKGAKISKLDDPGRGVQPVRHHYKVDESKLLPSKRLGINLNVCFFQKVTVLQV